MRRKSLRNLPEVKKDLQRILNRTNVPMKYRRLAVADIKHQLDRIDSIRFKKPDNPVTKRRPRPNAPP